jgi:ribosome-associated protein
MRINSTITISPGDITEQFVRASGPGGQNVNKVSTAVQLRFDAARSAALSDAVRRRLTVLAGRRMTTDGVLVIDARRFRSQERNRDDAYARLTDLIQRAAAPPKPRRPTKPSKAERERRLEGKRLRSRTKRGRGAPSGED